MTVGGTITHDHELNIGGTVYHLKLMRDKNGVAMCHVIEDVPAYSPKLEFLQKEWVGGHGQVDFNDPTMYFEGQSIDTTQPGVVFLGPYIVGTTSATAVEGIKNLVDAAVADDGGVMTTETTVAGNNTANDMTLLPATPAVDDAYYIGHPSKYDRVKLNVGTAGVGTWTIVWEYYTGAAWATLTLTGTGNDFKTAGLCTFTITKPADWATTTVNSIASMYWIRARVSAYTAVTTQPKGTQCWVANTDGATILMDSTPIKFLWFPATGKAYCVTTTKLYEYTDPDWFETKDFGAVTITDICVHNAYLFVALGNATAYQYSTNGGVFTAIADPMADLYANYFLSAPNPAGTAIVLWKAKTPNQVANHSDGITTSEGWAQSAYIGDTSGNITGIANVGDRIMIGKVDNLYYYDVDGGVHALMDDLKTLRSTDNFKYVRQWQGNTYCSLQQGMAEFGGGSTYDPMGPLYDNADIGKIGSIVGISSDRDFLYVAVDEGTNTHIYKGRKLNTASGLKWSWCPWVFVGENSISTCEVIQHTTSVKRLWFGYGNAPAYVTINEYQASGYGNFSATGFITFSYFDGHNRNWDKLWQYIVTQTQNCATITAKTITAYYYKDASSTAIALTAAIDTNGTVRTYLTSALTCKRIKFRLDFATDSVIKTPILSLFQARGVEKPETSRVYECTYDIASSPTNSAETLRDLLRTARTSTTLIKYADLRFGDSTASTAYKWVLVQPGFPQETEVRQMKGREPELGITVRFQEVDYTIS